MDGLIEHLNLAPSGALYLITIILTAGATWAFAKIYAKLNHLCISVDRMERRLSEYEDHNDTAHKEMHEEINRIKEDVATIKGRLKTNE